MKTKLLKLMIVGVGLLTSSIGAIAETITVSPTATTIDPTKTDALYDASATTWNVCQSDVSSSQFKSYNYPILIAKFDATEKLSGKTVTSATLSFDAVCTDSKYNAQVETSSITLPTTDWDITKATWSNTNSSSLAPTELSAPWTTKGATTSISIDVTTLIQSNQVLGIGIYTLTAREHTISNLVLTIEAVDASSAANYTVKFVDGDGTEIKTAETRTGAIGNSVTLLDTDKESIYNSDKTKKYVYSSDDAASQTIANDGTTVVTVKFSEASTYTYTVNALDSEGNSLKAGIKTGSGFAGDAINVAYPTYFLVDNTLYSAKKLSSDGKGYYLNITLDGNVTKDITYTASDITNVVYFEEGENLSGATAVTTSNAAIRSSNGGAGYAASKSGGVTITTLPAGTYKMTAVIINANSGTRTFTFTAGENTILTCAAAKGNNWSSFASDEFSLSAATAITLGEAGDKNAGVDLIYIQKTGEDVTVTSDGYATYCPLTTGVTFPTESATIAAYKASINTSDNTVTLTRVYDVAKGEGVLLRSLNGGEATLTVTANSSATTADDNAFVGVTEETTITSGYVLNKKNDKVGFYKAKTSGTKVAAGKAYLPATTSTSEASSTTFTSLKMVFEGEITGIEDIKVEKAEGNDVYYDLRGQRVISPSKGLYIQNGKKVIVK